MIVCLRPTQSKSLWEQMIGRGVRISEWKSDCLLLDMAGNLSEHGGLGAPHREKGKRESRAEIGKVCPECETWHSVAVLKVCPPCGYIFPEAEATRITHNQNFNSKDDPIYKEMAGDSRRGYEIYDVSYRRHKKAGKPDSIKVDYLSTTAKYGSVAEWISPHSDSEWAVQNCWKFFKDRGRELPRLLADMTIDELLIEAEYLKKPIKIIVDETGEWARIKDYIYGEQKSSGSSYSESVNSLDSGELLEGDFIPY